VERWNLAAPVADLAVDGSGLLAIGPGLSKIPCRSWLAQAPEYACFPPPVAHLAVELQSLLEESPFYMGFFEAAAA
jgi:hypothetical protein